MNHLINSSANALILGSAVRAILIACIAEVVLRALRVRETSVRLFAWKSVLAIALAMPILGMLLPPLFVPVPGFLRNASRVSHEERSDRAFAIQNVRARPTAVFQEDQASSTG